MTEAGILKAFPFDAVDPMGGDHEFYAPDDAVDYVHGVDTFESLVAKVKATDDFDDEYEFDSIVGFWIVTDKVYDIAGSVWPKGGCGNDSTCNMPQCWDVVNWASVFLHS